ncbi:hypothetical protein C8T65DRAFT_741124 [Cerioporus squamosus]|nr:hypothetical protein C8T65DRAFT_741124 [Cerioporus squamosus]
MDIAPAPGQLEGIQDKILVRSCYREALVAICLLALTSRDKGMILTGQPGTGKTLFIWYLLVCLLLKDQVVLLNVEDQRPFLFYRGQVYTAQSCKHLPQSSTAFIWSLLDPFRAPPPGSTDSMVFPVQAASPDGGLYKEWRMTRAPILTALPVKLLPEFSRFELDLSMLTENWGQVPAWYDFPYSGTRVLLEEQYKVLEPKRPSTVDDALEALFDALIAHFGLVARDVFHGLFDFSTVEHTHQEALPLWCDRLRDMANAVDQEQYLDSNSEFDLCIIPQSKVGEPFRWIVDFKSPVIAQRAAERIERQENARETLSYIWTHPPENAQVAVDLLNKALTRQP